MKNSKQKLCRRKYKNPAHTFTFSLCAALTASLFYFTALQSHSEAATYTNKQLQQKQTASTRRKTVKARSSVKSAQPTTNQKQVKRSSRKGSYKISNLPGVNYDTIPLYERGRNSVQQGNTVSFASAGAFGRHLPKGLRVAHNGVQTSCLKPQLISLLSTIQNHYKRPVVIISGYRSKAHNHRVRGAKNSLHMSCSAADIQIPGVHKSELARFVRSLSNRGGVGTYCQPFIHVDIGSRRDWNWGCGKKR